MCGLSTYIVGFMFEGYGYHWSTEQHCFISPLTFAEFKTVPVGAYSIVTSRVDPDDEAD